VLDETDVLLDDLQEWKRPDLCDDRPGPLVVEVYLDTSHLTQNQALVIVDDAGKRWDVADALASSADSSPRPARGGGRHYDVVLERWTVELGDAGRYKAADLNDFLPNVYKKGVVLFRSLYTFARFLPAWKLHKRILRQPGNSQPMKLRFRIRQGRGSSAAAYSSDALSTPLCPSDISDSNGDITEHHEFPPLLCPAGPLSISVDYRINCDFSIADAETLLSSRFAGLDAGDLHGRGGVSLPGDHRPRSQEAAHDRPLTVAGAARGAGRVAGGGAYGSLGTFHVTGKRESPVSALRQRTLSQADTTSPSPRTTVRPQAIPASAAEMDYLKNPPFKAGSVTSSSPRNTSNAASLSPSTSAPRPSTLTGTSASSKRLSLNTLPQQALRNPGMAVPDTAIASSGSSSPKPAPVHRYSSSFANRKRFTSTSQSSKAGESNTSSGRGSSSSKEKSGQLNEGSGTPGSSGRADEDDIAAFISSIERAKSLKAFTSNKPAAQNTVNLAKFKHMTAGTGELADEMSSSSLIQTSITPPSRRLSAVPGLSTSSSPSRALAHAPHVRSRLSTHSIAEEREREVEDEGQQEGEDSDEDEPFIFQQDNIL